MQVDRAQIVLVIRDFAETLGRPASVRPPVVRAEDPRAAREALREACERNGVTVEQYEAALRIDPSLADLEKQAMLSCVVPEPDPGPYDAISPESPSGQPGDLSKPRLDSF